MKIVLKVLALPLLFIVTVACIRLRSLGEGYSEEELRAVISGKSLHKSKGGFRQAPEQKQFHLLIDIQSKMAEGKSVGYQSCTTPKNR